MTNFDSSAEACRLFDELQISLPASGDLVSRSPIDGRQLGAVSSSSADEVVAANRPCPRSIPRLAARSAAAARASSCAVRRGASRGEGALGRLVSLEAGKILQEGSAKSRR
jgi:acyl-CoA reductase-like NAD-dependent aldehyde dehydrogenase